MCLYTRFYLPFVMYTTIRNNRDICVEKDSERVVVRGQPTVLKVKLNTLRQ